MTLVYNADTDNLINFEVYNGNKIIMVFEDFIIKEYNLLNNQAGELLNELNLRDLIGEVSEEDRIVTFAIDMDLGMIAVACLS